MTTGLVSLEALACGAQVVSTDRGYASEYLGSDAWYGDPGDPRSIRTAVDQAMAARGHPRLRQRVLDRYTWRRAAEATIRGYKRVLAREKTSIRSISA